MKKKTNRQDAESAKKRQEKEEEQERMPISDYHGSLSSLFLALSASWRFVGPGGAS
jgi:hypothetical protein